VTRNKGLAALTVVILAVFWYIRADVPEAEKPTAGTNIIAFGDSLVEGHGATPGNDFVSLLSRRIGAPIINAGQGGDTTSAALARLDSDVLARDPRVVIVLLGGNDFLRRVPKEQTFANLATIAERIRSTGAAVVLVGVNVGLWRDPYGDEYENVARRTSAGLVPDILDDILGDQHLMTDSIHPNDRGYQIVADRVEPALRELLKED